MDLLVTLVAFIGALGLLIVFHEFGHFVVARLFDVKVLRFSVGFGAPLIVKRWGRDATEWAISAFPLGGYVKMLDEREAPVAANELPRAFNRQSVGRRFAIVLAGPGANFLLAIVLYWALFMTGVPGLKPVLGDIAPQTPAAQAGFERGETITSIGGNAVETWEDVRWTVLKLVGEQPRAEIAVKSESGNIAFRALDLETLNSPEALEGDILAKLGLTRFRPDVAPIISEVVAGGAAEQAGLRGQDEIISIDGEPIESWTQVVERVRGAPQKTLAFVVLRGGAEVSLSITPERSTETGKPTGKMGAGPVVDRSAMERLLTEVRYGPLESLNQALVKTWDTSLFTLKMLGRMLVGEVSWKNLSGPITIADFAGQTAQLGLVYYLGFLALISISLGVLNLLPIPLLDGGHLMYYTAEILKGSPVSERVMEIGQRIGIALLFTLMAFALYNDINRLLSS
ncbi:MAG TPA: RIP metalloprotease RseP [Burkholderiales bacterium]|nr:RIP metalloprotease RseP [Burkholderiales bacterium]